ncbi:hypothetical protein, partial [Pseudomonas haemolytica]|uniref:hypothetical protein n=1 Tax=Pseudomonas haemolytica TaxID=2600065 RepID=UPI001E3B7215
EREKEEGEKEGREERKGEGGRREAGEREHVEGLRTRRPEGGLLREREKKERAQALCWVGRRDV